MIFLCKDNLVMNMLQNKLDWEITNDFMKKVFPVGRNPLINVMN